MLISIVLVAGLFIASRAAEWGGTAAVPASEPQQTAMRADPKRCEDLIASGVKHGLVRARPAANRINVDDSQWTALPADIKKQFAAAARCAARSRDVLDFGVVYGFRSGKRLAIATSAGVSLE